MAYDSGTIPTLAELISAKFVPEIFSKNVIMHTMSNLVVANAVNTEYRADLRIGYKVQIPVLSEITDQEVQPGSEPTAVNIASASPKSIEVDQWRVAAGEISDMAAIEDHVGYLNKVAESCGYRIAKRVDTKLGGLFFALGGTVYGSSGQTLTDDIVLALMEYLDAGDVPSEDRSFIINPSSKTDLLKIDKFVRNDYVRAPVVATGQFGTIYGMPVLMSNNLPEYEGVNLGVMMHRDALGLVIQKSPRAQLINKPWEFVTVAQVDVIFGVGELRDTFGRPYYCRTT